MGDSRKSDVGEHFNALVANAVARSSSGLNVILPCNAEHQLNLLQLISTSYLHLKASMYAKSIIEFKPSNRQKLTKLILFEGN